jgi:exodeoxyribonuclease VII large subunit
MAEQSGRLAQSAALLHSYSYQQVLARGFALVRDAAGHSVGSAAAANAGDRWSVTFADNQPVPVTVDGPPAPRRKPAQDGRQASFFSSE